jgi:hypothetical protein
MNLFQLHFINQIHEDLIISQHFQANLLSEPLYATFQEKPQFSSGPYLPLAFDEKPPFCSSTLNLTAT